MELTIYEELYHTPLKICFGIDCCGRVNCSNPPRNNHNNGNYGLLPNNYLLKNHQDRTVASKITRISQEGLEKRAEHQESKRISLKNEMLILGALKSPIQSKRAEKRRRGRKRYKHYRTGDWFTKFLSRILFRKLSEGAGVVKQAALKRL